MLIYQSERTNNRSFIVRQWLFTTIGISLPATIDLLFLQINLVNNSYFYLYIPVFSLAKLFWLSQDNRINKIAVDTDNKQIVFKHYNPHEGQKIKKLPFESLRIKTETSKMPWLFDQLEICFLINKAEVFKATRWKDGFSPGTLNDLRKTLDSLTSPVKK